MPYIHQEIREDASINPQNEGELNFAITSILTYYVGEHGLCYKTINDILGALEGAKLEFYRRIAVPYENAKISENGDVY
jgi:hypothetical protein